MMHAMHARRLPLSLTALLLLFPLLLARGSEAATPSGVPSTDGEALFRQQCGTCHTVKKEDGPRAGPSLHGILGRKAGAMPGFEYSDALRTAGFTWDPAHLERWLTNSGDLLPGSVMNYRQEDGTVRQGIIRFLQSGAAN
ncbi:c-type cytochrome [Azospirillum doebereinerae]